ncbi:MAG: hypothetical protein A2Y10_00555 [Planctomycetes bacterium GWF2_41_51]|nr:MAG: hypothetical protein A2Y10_00555 [Planctomycetes bacterium GWF2_41_51]HBG26892.1 hypothetical protein [Phycisphaerales bacterium]
MTDVRRLTESQIKTLGLIAKKGRITQNGVAEELNITVPAANVRFKKLKAQGYIYEDIYLPSSGAGRPQRYWSINWKSNFVLGFIFVSPDLIMVLADLEGNLVFSENRNLLECLSHADIYDLMDKFISEAKKYAKKKNGAIRSAYVGITGDENGTVTSSVNMPVIEGMNVSQIEEYIKDKHNIFCKAYSHLYCFYFGESSYYDYGQTINVIDWDEGLGNVTGCEDQIYYFPPGAFTPRGIRDIGHMCIEKNGLECRCGNKGCLEAYVGCWAIRNRLGRKDVTTIEQFINKGLAGDEQIIAELRKASKILGEQISWIVRYWGIDKIAFTGKMSLLFEQFNETFNEGLKVYLPQEQVQSLDARVNSDNPLKRLASGGCKVAKQIFFHYKGIPENSYSEKMNFTF